MLSGKRIAQLPYQTSSRGAGRREAAPAHGNSNAPTPQSGIYHCFQEEIWMESDAFGYGSWSLRDSLQPASSIAMHFISRSMCYTCTNSVLQFENILFCEVRIHAYSYMLVPVNVNRQTIGTDISGNFLYSWVKELNFLYNSSCIQVLSEVPVRNICCFYLNSAPSRKTWAHQNSKKLMLPDTTPFSADQLITEKWKGLKQDVSFKPAALKRFSFF